MKTVPKTAQMSTTLPAKFLPSFVPLYPILLHLCLS